MAKSRARKLADIIVGAGIDIDGNLTFDGGSTSADLTFADGDKANFGDASDLQIFHDSSSGYSQIKETGPAGLLLRSDDLRLQSSTGENGLRLIEDGAIKLYYNNSEKFETLTGGAKVTGQLTATSDFIAADSGGTARGYLFGTSGGLFLRYNSGSNLQIQEAGSTRVTFATGGATTFVGNVTSPNLIANTATYSPIVYGGSSNLQLKSNTAEMFAQFVNNGAAELYYDNSKKLETFSGGVSVTGQLNATTMHLPDGSTGLQLGASNDTKFFHDGSNSKITHSGSGGFYIGADTLGIQTGAHNENYLTATANGAVYLYYDNASKLATDSGGINVTGAVDASSEFLVGSQNSRFAENNLRFKSSGAAYIDHNTVGQPIYFRTSSSSSLDTTPFWINNSGVGVPGGFIQSGSSAGSLTLIGGSTNHGGKIVLSGGNTTDSDIKFYAQQYTATPSERMRITKDGNVGIGTTSPATKLEVAGTTPVIRLTDSRLLDNPSWDNVSLGSVQFYTSDTSSPGARVGAEIEAFADGDSASAPNFNLLFKTATNTGTATEKLRIDKDGRVGIGTTSPVQALDVVGSIQTDTAFRAYDSVGGAYRNVLRYDSGNVRLETGTGSTARELGVWTAGTERIRVDTSGNVGIGTTSPAYKLDVSAGSAIAARFTGGDSNGITSIFTRASEQGLKTWSGNSYYSGLVAGAHFQIFTNNSPATPRVTVLDTGNVGIGTTNPGCALDIERSSGWSEVHLNGASGGDLILQDNGVNYGEIYAGNGHGMVLKAHSGQHMYFLTNGDATAKAVITNGGNVGIGTTAPVTSLSFGEASTGITFLSTATNFNSGKVAGIRGEVGGTGYGNLAFDTFQGGNGGGERMMIRYDGNVGIGTTSPGAKLQIQTSHTQTDVTNANSYSTLNVANSGAGNGVYNAIKFAANQQDMYIMSFNNNQQANRRLGFFLGSVAGDATTDERLSITGNGRVGINLATPSYPLHLINPSDTNQMFRVLFPDAYFTEIGTSRMSTGNTQGLFINAQTDIKFGTSGTETMRLTSTGKLGIGTSAPATGTHTSYQNLVIGETTSSTSGLSFKASTSGQSAIFFSDGTTPFNRGQVLYDHSTDSLTLASNGVEKLRLDGSGQTNVRLGGSTTNGTTVLSSCTSTSSSGGTGTGNTLELEFMEPSSPNFGAKKLRLGVQGGGYVKMDFPGSAGLYAISPYQANDKFHIGYAGVSLDMNGGGYGGNQHMLIRCKNDITFHPGGSERWRMIAHTSSTPAVFVTNQTTVTNIGGTPPDLNSLELGPGYLNLNRDDTVSATQIQFGKNGSVAGSIVTTSSTTYNTTSDRRAKENIVDAQDAGELIDGIQVREFDWKNSGEHQRYGMVAQELLEVAPEVVHQPESEEQMMGVDYSKLVPMLVKEIQSLRARVAELEGE